MTNAHNPFGLDLDASGVPLQTPRNMAILEDIERRKAAEAAYYGAPAVQYYSPAPGAGYVDPRFADPRYTDPRYTNPVPGNDIYYSSAESERTMYDAGKANYYTPPRYDVNPNTYGGNKGSGKAVPDRFDSAPTQINSGFIQTEHLVPKERIDYNYVWVPIDGEYHSTLLPKGYEEQKVELQEQEISRKEKAGVTIVTAIKHFKRQILSKGDNIMGTDRFSENLFDSTSIGAAKLKEFEIIDYLADEITGMEYFSSGQLVDVLMKHHRANNQEDAVYLLDYYHINGYFNNTGKNLFFDLQTNATTIQEATTTLSTIHDIYSRNPKTTNSIKLIDAVLTQNFIEFVVGYTGIDILRNTCSSFMKEAGLIYEKAKSLPDVVAQNSLRTAIERFISALFRNIVAAPKEVIADCGIQDNELTIPLRELSITTTNKDILAELASIEKENSSFFYIDKNYAVSLSDLLETLNAKVTFENYSKITLFTYTGLYQVVRNKNNRYYINSLKLFK